MENIILTFSCHTQVTCINQPTIILTINETGKHFMVDSLNGIETVKPPKRVVTTFTRSAVTKIFANDEIPQNQDLMVLDGNSYEIAITIGNLSKEYSADDISIETYPLVSYIASWYRRLII